MVEHWSTEARDREDEWPDRGLVSAGLDLFAELGAQPSAGSLLATDLHAGNVLRARRRPWLAIDPKPFVGDPAYDATQHLLNCRARLTADPAGTIGRFAALLDVEPARVRAWTFARETVAPMRGWSDPAWRGLVEALAP